MKRLLSLLLVIAMLFGVCTIFTACDSSSSVSDEDDDDEDDKKKDDEDDEDDVEPTLVLKGLKIVLPEDFDVDDDDISEYDDSANAMIVGRNYTVYVTCGPMEEEIEGMNAKEFRDYILDQMDPDDEDTDVGEYDSGTKNKTPYIYAIKDDETMAMAMSFYVDDNYAWQVRILSNEDSEDFSVEEMVDLITGWKYKAPEPGNQENEDDDDNDEIEIPVTGPNEGYTEPTEPEIYGDIIYDNMGVVVSVTDTIMSDYACDIQLYIRNNTDHAVSVSSDTAILNYSASINIDFYGYVQSGRDTFVNIYLPMDELVHYGTEVVGSLEFTLDVFNDDTYEIIDTASVGIYTEHDGVYSNAYNGGYTLFDADHVRVILQEMVVEYGEDYVMWLYVENYSNEYISITLSDIVVNGWLLPEAYGYAFVQPGTYSIIALDLNELYDLDVYTQEDIQNIRFAVNCYNLDYDGYYTGGTGKYTPGSADYVMGVYFDSTNLYYYGDFELRWVDVEDTSDYADLKLFIRNPYDYDIQVWLENIYINGIYVDECYSFTIPAGTRCFDYMTIWYDYDEVPDSYEEFESISATLFVDNYAGMPPIEADIDFFA